MKTWVIAILSFGLLMDECQAQTVVQGQADLTRFDFSANEPLELSGTWEFYWNTLLSPKDFELNQNPEWVNVPGSWHRQGKYPRLGFGTYRTRLQLSGKESGLSLYFPIVNSSSRIWLNGELAVETGVVGTDKNSYTAKLSGSVLSVPEKIKELEIIVQAANYTYYNSGIGNTPQLGQSSSIFLMTNKLNGIENFFAGSLIAMFVYQFILYFLHHRGKPHLWLALICLGVALRSLIVHGGSFLLPNLFPSVGFEIWKKIEFGSVYAVITLFPLYVYHLFTEAAPKRPLIFFIAVSGILCGFRVKVAQVMKRERDLDYHFAVTIC